MLVQNLKCLLIFLSCAMASYKSSYYYDCLNFNDHVLNKGYSHDDCQINNFQVSDNQQHIFQIPVLHSFVYIAH